MMDDGLISILLWVALASGIVVGISGIGLFIMWIRFSLIKRHNSLNYTGRDMTQHLFNENGVSAEIKDSYFYVKYWNHNKSKNTYKLRPWTSNRRSIWTLMEASQQAYATIIRETNAKAFWTAFRLPRIIRMGGVMMGVALAGWGIYINKEINSTSDISWSDWFKITIGLSIAFLSVMYAEVAKSYLLRKNVPAMLQNSGLSEYELKSIKSIFTWSFIYAIANAILQTIKVVLEILSKINKKNNT